LFYGREISTMLPNQSIFGGKLHIIRPLAYLQEGLVKKYSRERAFPTVKNECPTSKSAIIFTRRLATSNRTIFCRNPKSRKRRFQRFSAPWGLSGKGAWIDGRVIRQGGFAIMVAINEI
jgi:tRNA 2-thiocytidine biosynthesis protein TtcA